MICSWPALEVDHNTEPLCHSTETVCHSRGVTDSPFLVHPTLLVAGVGRGGDWVCVLVPWDCWGYSCRACGLRYFGAVGVPIGDYVLFLRRLLVR